MKNGSYYSEGTIQLPSFSRSYYRNANNTNNDM